MFVPGCLLGYPGRGVAVNRGRCLNERCKNSSVYHCRSQSPPATLSNPLPKKVNTHTHFGRLPLQHTRLTITQRRRVCLSTLLSSSSSRTPSGYTARRHVLPLPSLFFLKAVFVAMASLGSPPGNKRGLCVCVCVANLLYTQPLLYATSKPPGRKVR